MLSLRTSHAQRNVACLLLCAFGSALLLSTALHAQFVEITPPELHGPNTCSGAAWGDFDGDGDLDVYLTNSSGPNQLLRNDGPAGFIDVTGGVLALVPDLSQGAAWADLDNDGHLDLAIVESGGANRLLRNDGAGGFVLIPGAIADPGEGSTIAFVDFDGNGLLDIAIGNTLQPNILYRNLGGLQFAPDAGLPFGDSGSAGGFAFGDFDGDGDADLYLSNIGEQNRLLRNDSGVFVDVTPPALLGFGPTVSANWIDYDNDLDLDLYVVGFFTAAKLFRNDGPGGFVEVTAGTPLATAASGFVAVWADLDNDGDLDLYLVNHLSPNQTFRYDGGGVFTDITGPEAAIGSVSTDATWVDIDQDGDLDLYLTDGGGPNRLYRNDQATGHHWIQLRLEGRSSNRSAIGAQAIVTTVMGSQLRAVEGSNGFHSQNSLDLEFGLGTANLVDTIEIRWPSGIVQHLHAVAVNQILTIVEPVRFVRGDANADGAFDLADAVAALEYLFLGGALACVSAADANDDDAVNLGDPIYSLGTLFLGGPPPAPPFPGCDVDPTPGTLGCGDFPSCP